jgi:hypothetical protein
MTSNIGATSAPFIVLDTHVHLYLGADWGQALTAGRDNLAAAAHAADHRTASYGLLLTETARDDAFGALAGGRLSPKGWIVHPIPNDAAALWLERELDGATLLLVAGHQIITQEGIEVLALATTHRVADFQPIRTVLDELKRLGIPAVLPWGVGKWIGARGATIAALLSEAERWNFMLGDNAGRPAGWMTPPLFGKAATKNVPVLPGSDPLPLPRAETGIGRFGCLIDGHIDSARPAEDLRARLLSLASQPVVIGRRRGPLAVVGEQIALRLHKARRGSTKTMTDVQ